MGGLRWGRAHERFRACQVSKASGIAQGSEEHTRGRLRLSVLPALTHSAGLTRLPSVWGGELWLQTPRRSQSREREEQAGPYWCPQGNHCRCEGGSTNFLGTLLPRHELCVGKSSVEQGSVALGRRPESASVPGRYEFICRHCSTCTEGCLIPGAR